MWAINNSKQGQLLIPKIPSFKIYDLIKALYPECKIRISGLRPGEKIHEDLISINETNLYDIGNFYSIYPTYTKKEVNRYKFYRRVSEDFMMNSGSYEKKLNGKNLLARIKLLNFS